MTTLSREDMSGEAEAFVSSSGDENMNILRKLLEKLQKEGYDILSFSCCFHPKKNKFLVLDNIFQLSRPPCTDPEKVIQIAFRSVFGGRSTCTVSRISNEYEGYTFHVPTNIIAYKMMHAIEDALDESTPLHAEEFYCEEDEASRIWETWERVFIIGICVIVVITVLPTVFRILREFFS